MNGGEFIIFTLLVDSGGVHSIYLIELCFAIRNEINAYIYVRSRYITTVTAYGSDILYYTSGYVNT